MRQKLKLHELSLIKPATLKNSIKHFILKLQKMGDEKSWSETEVNVTSMLGSNQIPGFIYDEDTMNSMSS